MKRVLIISPHFPPVNTPDMQRVRMLIPFLPDHGWQPEVLAVQPDQISAPQDPWLEETLPPGLPVHRVKAMGLAWTRLPGLGTLGFRSLSALSGAGGRLLATGRFDLVYFSTTVFQVHVLGPRWKRLWRVPFAMDYQDPWVTDYYREHPEVTPPGGRLKYGVLDRLHRHMEPRVLKECAGFTSVSPAYPAQLANRYRGFRLPLNRILPFPGSGRDLEKVRPESANGALPWSPHDGCIHWLYAGVIIPGMLPALRAFFEALRKSAPAGLLEKLRLHFVGTTYAARGEHHSLVLPAAAEFGLAHLVREEPRRVPYSQVLAMLRQSDALLAFGSNDTGYTASKIYPCLLAEKPLLAVFHGASSVVSLLEQTGGGICVAFATGEPTASLAARIAQAWLQDNQWSRPVPLDKEAFAPCTDSGSAAMLAGFFNDVVKADN